MPDSPVSAGTSPAHSPPSSTASAGTSPAYSPPSSPDRTGTSRAVLRALSEHLLSLAEDPKTWKERGFRPVPQLSDGYTLVEAHRIDDLVRANRRSESELRIVTEDRDRLNCRREELLRERAELGVNTKQLRSTVRGLNRRVQELTAANPAAKAEKVKRLESEKLCLRSDMEVLLQENKALKAKSDKTQRELLGLRCTTKMQREVIEHLHAGKAVMYRSWQEEWSKHEQLKRKLEEPHAREGPRCKARRGSWS
ncbi:hypothetical protein CYMTET_47247 [Cymbomonas tetramitiformis]|uniref:Uncharacterized protein n=1 Tax=Cymbomonas tetramitiformis TaxID=36881 RepID=A0AAE0BWE3_9CHLO|nr:hypothetical protein CYMTET_47247 [Cymbomonas tetramitiformis]